MKKLFLFLTLILLLFITTYSQSQTISLVMCERYDMELGPVGISPMFTTGYLTVVAMSTSPMYYDKVYIQYDKLSSDGKYYFYKKFPFTFPNGKQIVYFSRVGNNDMEFNHSGNYIVWLLDKYGDTIAYTLVTIVD